jgi:hypothetical protein
VPAANTDLQEALELLADHSVRNSADYSAGFMPAGSHPDCFSAVYREPISWDQENGSIGQVEFRATTRTGDKLTTTRLVPAS